MSNCSRTLTHTYACDKPHGIGNDYRQGIGRGEESTCACGRPHREEEVGEEELRPLHAAVNRMTTGGKEEEVKAPSEMYDDDTTTENNVADVLQGCVS